VFGNCGGAEDAVKSRHACSSFQDSILRIRSRGVLMVNPYFFIVAQVG
jgi:hypothetical protein